VSEGRQSHPPPYPCQFRRRTKNEDGVLDSRQDSGVPPHPSQRAVDTSCRRCRRIRAGTVPSPPSTSAGPIPAQLSTPQAAPVPAKQNSKRQKCSQIRNALLRSQNSIVILIYRFMLMRILPAAQRDVCEPTTAAAMETWCGAQAVSLHFHRAASTDRPKLKAGPDSSIQKQAAISETLL